MNDQQIRNKARRLDESALRWNIRDAREAIEANPGNPKREFYEAEIRLYTQELDRRK